MFMECKNKVKFLGKIGEKRLYLAKSKVLKTFFEGNAILYGNIIYLCRRHIVL